jgi:peptidyl-dipeptidase Dcp
MPPLTAAPTAHLPADNPFASPSALPYHTPPFDRVREAHYVPAFAEGMRVHLAEVRTIANDPAPPTFANTIEALERAGALLTRVAKVFFNLTESTTNPTIQGIQADVAPRLAAHQDAIWLDRTLFARVEAVHAAREALTGPEQRRLTERYHLAFVRSGARLDDAAQQRLRAVNTELSSLTTAFQERLLADTKALAVVVERAEQLDGLDPSAVSAAAAAAEAAGRPGRFLLALQLPSSQGVLASLRDRTTRGRVFAASLARCSRPGPNDTRELVTRIAALRAERAGLLGFACHADYALADQMAGSAAAVRDLLARMTPPVVAKARAEAEELQAWLDRAQPGARLEAHDWAWVAEQVRAERYAFDDNAVKQYFALDTVLEHGVFAMARQLYGITLHARTDLPVYHPDARVYEVFDRDGRALGLYYGDWFAREGKRGGAWMDTFVDQSELLGDLPVVVNVMNVAKPAAGQPALLRFDEVTTLFHEFGHAVHGLFSQVRHPFLSGTNVPRDFVEFPSQFHEDFAFDPAVLARCAVHWQTGESLPADVVVKVRAARRHGQGFASFEYLAAAALDLAWHSLAPGERVDDVDAFETAALERAGLAWELIPPRYRSAYFSHVWPGGYAAGYYAYLWSEALAADAFAYCTENGGMTPANGARFRDEVLSRGMTREPLAMFTAFRGRELDPGPLLRRRGLQ